MVKHTSPNSLYDICRKDICDLLIRIVEASSKDHDFMELCRFVEEQLSSSAYTDLVEEIMHNDQAEHHVQAKLLKFTLSPRVSSLSFASVSQSLYSHIMECLLKSGTGLTSLSLVNVWVEGEDKRSLSRALGGMSSLKRLIVRQISDDALLSVVSSCCQMLEHLDISSSPDVTDCGIRSIRNLVNLTKVDLGGMETNVSVECVAQLFSHCPLRSLGAYPFTCKVIRMIPARIPVQLRYLHDRDTSLDDLSLAFQRCPDLIRCFLDSPQEGFDRVLCDFHNLRELKLSRVPADQVHSSTERLPRLVSLILVTIRDVLDLNVVAVNCPVLTSIEVYYSAGVRAVSPLAFGALQTLKVYATSAQRLRSLSVMAGCPRLQTLNLCDCEDLNDDVVFEAVTGSGLLQECRELVLTGARLSDQMARHLILELPCLQSLGRLGTWMLTELEVEELRQKAEAYNFDLELIM